MSGFWTQTEAGHTVHVNGDPSMSEETRAALTQVMDALIKEKQVEDKAFKDLWGKLKDVRISEDDASWWFNEGIEYQKAQSKKRIEWQEKRLGEEVEQCRQRARLRREPGSRASPNDSRTGA